MQSLEDDAFTGLVLHTKDFRRVLVWTVCFYGVSRMSVPPDPVSAKKAVNHEPWFPLGEATGITALTVVSYVTVYAFISAQTIRFHIPSEYINIGPGQLTAAATLITITLLGSVFLAGAGIFAIRPIDKRASETTLRSRLVACVLFLLISSILFIFLFRTTQPVILIFLIPIATQVALLAAGLRRWGVNETRTLFYWFYAISALTVVFASFLLGIVTENYNSFRVVLCGEFRDYAIVWTANDLVFLARVSGNKVGDPQAMVKVDKDAPLVTEMQTLPKASSSCPSTTPPVRNRTAPIQKSTHKPRAT
jgi:hypothetical protein